ESYLLSLFFSLSLDVCNIGSDSQPSTHASVQATLTPKSLDSDKAETLNSETLQLSEVPPQPLVDINSQPPVEVKIHSKTICEDTFPEVEIVNIGDIDYLQFIS